MLHFSQGVEGLWKRTSSHNLHKTLEYRLIFLVLFLVMMAWLNASFVFNFFFSCNMMFAESGQGNWPQSIARYIFFFWKYSLLQDSNSFDIILNYHLSQMFKPVWNDGCNHFINILIWQTKLLGWKMVSVICFEPQFSGHRIYIVTYRSISHLWLF